MRYERRRYHRPSELGRDVWEVMGQVRGIRTLVRGELVGPDFRERLMLAVTAVNDCRYCSFGHARLALSAGVQPSDVARLVEGDLGEAPPEQLPALLYAQHWAEADGRPDASARERVVAVYGEDVAQQIELALRMIRVGNLTGNTVDVLLDRMRAVLARG
jgi:AhpD family alkylhydroperoxidase